MNWEVPIMRSKTSLFNGSIFRSNFSRFWPLWAAYLVLLLIIVPTSFTSSLRDELYNGYLSPTNMEIGVEFLQILPNSHCTREQLVFLHDHGIRTTYFVANSKEKMEEIGREGHDFIFTDRYALLRPVYDSNV